MLYNIIPILAMNMYIAGMQGVKYDATLSFSMSCIHNLTL